MRVFYAIEFDEETKEFLDTIKNKVKEKSVKGKFTSMNNFHLTLKFIGEVKNEKLSTLKKCADTIAENTKPFYINFEELSEFTRGDKCIPWIGIRKSMELTSLHESLDDKLEQEGFKKEERIYKPHITLGRQVEIKTKLKDIYSNDKDIEKTYLVGK